MDGQRSRIQLEEPVSNVLHRPDAKSSKTGMTHRSRMKSERIPDFTLLVVLLELKHAMKNLITRFFSIVM